LSLAPGTRIGGYEIVTLIGAGGMGEVYHARDARLRRDVAIKMLPVSLSGDRARLQRLEREAQLLASISHAGIATLYGVQDSDHGLALVMELVEGRTLAQAIAEGPLPLSEAIRIATALASALAAAHDRGVVHRDLKPANVMCAPGGAVKILDFGLAKALASHEAGAAPPADSPTITSVATAHGLILGTAAYMAPEQACGSDVDRRADIWAFGAVLYEMLTGRQAFDGRNSGEAIANVIGREPDWARLPASTPPAVRRLLRRCLQKSPDRRLHHVADAQLELVEALETPAAETADVRGPAPARAFVPIAAGVALATALAAFLIGRAVGAPPATTVEWVGERLGGSTVAMAPTVSPDGGTVAFMSIVQGLTQVAVMRPESGTWRVLTKERARGLVDHLTWSADGSRVFYSRLLDVPNGVYSVPVFGGDERLILENAISPRALPDGSLLVTRINADRFAQLHRFWPETGRIEALPALVAPLNRLPSPAYEAFPDGKAVVYVGRPADSAASVADHLYVLDLASRRSRRIAPDVTVTFTSFSFPLAVSSDGQSVLFTLPTGNTHPIVSVARDGSPGVQTVLPLMQRPVAMDVGADGRLFLDQLDQPAEIFRFDPRSGELERMPMPAMLTLEGGSALPLPDGRLLFATRTLGRDRMMVMTPGLDPVPFIDTTEETSGPMANLGADSVVLFAGSPPNRQLAIASIAGGRIVHRLAQVDREQVIVGVAGSPDGRTVYYVAGGTVWALNPPDGAPRRIRGGDGVAVAPDGRSLVVMLSEANGIRLVRHHLVGSDATDESIPLVGYRLSPWPIASNAVGRDGRLVVRVATPDSWFWPAAILSPRTGGVDVLPQGDAADMLVPGWDTQGRVVTIASFTRSTLWRFKPLNR
jgi:Tol biopolymer transport system component